MSDAYGAELVEAAVAGEPLALDRLLLHFSVRLRARLDRRMPADIRAIHSADDLLQEVLGEVFLRFGQFKLPPDVREPGERVFAWMCTIADHKVVDLVRSHRSLKRGGGRNAVRPHNESLAALIELVAIHKRTPSRSASGHEAEAAIRQALTSLPQDYREVLELRYLKGLDPADAAQRMNRSEHAIHNLCSRAISALREEIGDPARYLSRG